MRKFVIQAAVATLIVACSLCLPVAAQSGSSADHSQENTDSPNSQAQARMQASRMAVHALRLTDRARRAIISKDQSRAATDVNQALDLINKAGKELPAAGNKNNSHVVPIFAEMEQTSFLQPVLTAKSQVGSGQGSQSASNRSSQHQQSASNTQNQESENQVSASNQNPSAQESALPQSDRPPVVKRVEGGYSYIGLDLNAAKEHLQAAKQYLSKNEPGKADLELARTQDSVDTGAVTTTMPLVRARENLALARNEVKNNKYSKAKVNLAAASKALNQYGTQSQAKHAEDAKSLGSQIESYSSSIQSKHKEALSKIDNWWNQLADWTGQKSS